MHVSARRLHIKFIANSFIGCCSCQLFMSPHDDPLFDAMRVLVALSAVVENGYD